MFFIFYSLHLGLLILKDRNIWNQISSNSLMSSRHSVKLICVNKLKGNFWVFVSDPIGWPIGRDNCFAWNNRVHSFCPINKILKNEENITRSFFLVLLNSVLPSSPPSLPPIFMHTLPLFNTLFDQNNYPLVSTSHWNTSQSSQLTVLSKTNLI